MIIRLINNFNKRILILIIFLSLCIIGCLSTSYAKSKVVKKNSTFIPLVDISFENFEEQMKKNKIIKELPDNAKIMLRFYNQSSEKREKIKSYIISKASVKEGEIENPELLIEIPVHYIDPLNNKNFCSIIQEARKNGELSVINFISQSEFLWKYRNLMKYKSCFS